MRTGRNSYPEQCLSLFCVPLSASLLCPCSLELRSFSVSLLPQNLSSHGAAVHAPYRPLGSLVPENTQFALVLSRPTVPFHKVTTFPPFLPPLLLFLSSLRLSLLHTGFLGLRSFIISSMLLMTKCMLLILDVPCELGLHRLLCLPTEFCRSLR